MTKTKIEWCDMTWNPVTGCLHGCEYCYARSIARRFGGHWIQSDSGDGEGNKMQDDRQLHELGCPKLYERKNGHLYKAPFPYVFSPTFHGYRLNEPAKRKEPQNIFVCSMADLFGNWVPNNWIKKVFEMCMEAPQHRYLFLTENPLRYYDLIKNDLLPKQNNYWFGTTVPNDDDSYFCGKGYRSYNDFISMEPLQSNFEFDNLVTHYTDWVIIGAETGNRKGKVIPKREWIENIVNYCRKKKIPVFMKSSLAKIWKEPLIQEYPWRME